MKRNVRWLRAPGLAVCAGIASALLLSCGSNSYEGKLVAVEQEGWETDVSQLVVLDPAKPDRAASLLVEDFYSCRAPYLSHEGRYLYFQAIEKNGDPWQIWMLDLKKKDLKQITDFPENCTDPASLPDGSVVFSRESQVKGSSIYSLWKIHRDGCCLMQVTHNPGKNRYASVLWEGRILYASTEVVPEIRETNLMVMRPDGTKSEVYSQGCCGDRPVSGGMESTDGYIYFISGKGKLSRVLHRRPLHTFENLSEGIPGYFASVFPLEDGSCLVSYRPSEAETFGLYRFHPDKDQAPDPLIQRENHLTDQVLITAMEPRPRILPSPVDPAQPTALLMSQDINHSMLPAHPGLSGDTLARQIRISTLDGELAVVEARADGSFYVKVDADQPMRFETLNDQGEVVRGPSDWIYLRPNERRACTGCHADPELAPRNIQPLAVKEDPVILTAEKKETSP